MRARCFRQTKAAIEPVVWGKANGQTMRNAGQWKQPVPVKLDCLPRISKAGWQYFKVRR